MTGLVFQGPRFYHGLIMVYAIIGIYLLVINLVTFLLYAEDKAKARRGKWRIPEATLLLFAAIGGSVGALLAMLVLHHKTKHPKFYILVPLFLVIHIAIAVFSYLIFVA